MWKTVRDDLQRDVSFEFPPRRVVSLCPSLTETLFALGLDEGSVVGRTKYCVHPAECVQSDAVVGGTKTIDVEAVRALRPDLVIAAKEENPRETVETLTHTLPVFVFDVTDYDGALHAIARLGDLTGHAKQAQTLMGNIRAAFATLQPRTKRRVAYLIWQKPYMAAGQDTYIHSLLRKCGFENVCAELPGRYPEVSLDTLRKLRPEWLLLSTEPFRFAKSHIAPLTRHIPHTRVIGVDGEMFSWYGSRMLAAADYLKQFVAELCDRA